MYCPDGGTDCPNPVCQCQVTYLNIIYIPSKRSIKIMTLIFKDKENNEEWNRCLDSNSLIWGRCIYACGSNAECTDDCVTEFQEQIMNL